MPKKQPQKQQKPQPVSEESVEDAFDFDDEEDNQHETTREDETPTVPSRSGKKRVYNELTDDVGGEVHTLLDRFGSDISKSIVAKRKRLELLTQQSLKCSNRKVDDIFKGQNAERQRLSDEYCKQVMNVFEQWGTDINKMKDHEDKLQTLFRQQQKLFQQARIVQGQRLKTLRQLHEQYSKGMTDLESRHQDQHSNVQVELRKEMSLLQKKILMDTQNQEMANVRKSLQSMLW
ncbi:synaptonemal complex protein 3-like [Saccoglossus kowalevskii]|uniref:Synaptonemal complex protein 3-like n=1 Tax=Saccoglossus kowalevskii TaxID=10224 RepID=A0ABM0MD91_SACKO|nr:PREDICTED: synaptonemal complex protein 3-like [Saccoglossus kowalevskii]